MPEVCAKVAKIDGNAGGVAAKPRDFAADVPSRVQFTRTPARSFLGRRDGPPRVYVLRGRRGSAGAAAGLRGAPRVYGGSAPAPPRRDPSRRHGRGGSWRGRLATPPPRSRAAAEMSTPPQARDDAAGLTGALRVGVHGSDARLFQNRRATAGRGPREERALLPEARAAESYWHRGLREDAQSDASGDSGDLAASADYPRGTPRRRRVRGPSARHPAAAPRLVLGISTSRPATRPRNVKVAPRGGPATRPRNIRVAPRGGAATRPRNIRGEASTVLRR